MTPEQIAAKLTAAQRECLRSMFQDEARHAPYHVFPDRYWRRLDGLIKAGLIETDGNCVSAFRSKGRTLANAVLSPLGLAVRSILIAQEQSK